MACTQLSCQNTPTTSYGSIVSTRSTSPHDPHAKIGLVLNGGLLQLTQLVGLGTYAAVYVGQYRRGSEAGRQVAVKCLFKRGLTVSQLALQREEIHVNKRVGFHNHIVPLEMSFEDDACLYLVLELCCYGDLFDAITQRGGYDDNQALLLFRQIVDAVDQCHKRGVAHRDLKPENLLFAAPDRLKLADFGLATCETWATDFGCGSLPYMAPECVKAVENGPDGYDPMAADIWSIAIILFNLRFACTLWQQATLEDPSFVAFLQRPESLREAFRLSPAAFHLARRALDPDPRTRCTMSELRMLLDSCDEIVLSAVLDSSVAVTPLKDSRDLSNASSHVSSLRIQDQWVPGMSPVTPLNSSDVPMAAPKASIVPPRRSWADEDDDASIDFSMPPVFPNELIDTKEKMILSPIDTRDSGHASSLLAPLDRMTESSSASPASMRQRLGVCGSILRRLNRVLPTSSGPMRRLRAASPHVTRIRAPRRHSLCIASPVALVPGTPLCNEHVLVPPPSPQPMSLKQQPRRLQLDLATPYEDLTPLARLRHQIKSVIQARREQNNSVFA